MCCYRISLHFIQSKLNVNVTNVAFSQCWKPILDEFMLCFTPFNSDRSNFETKYVCSFLFWLLNFRFLSADKNHIDVEDDSEWHFSHSRIARDADAANNVEQSHKDAPKRFDGWDFAFFDATQNATICDVISHSNKKSKHHVSGEAWHSCDAATMEFFKCSCDAVCANVSGGTPLIAHTNVMWFQKHDENRVVGFYCSTEKRSQKMANAIIRRRCWLLLTQRMN